MSGLFLRVLKPLQRFLLIPSFSSFYFYSIIFFNIFFFSSTVLCFWHLTIFNKSNKISSLSLSYFWLFLNYENETRKRKRGKKKQNFDCFPNAFSFALFSIALSSLSIRLDQSIERSIVLISGTRIHSCL